MSETSNLSTLLENQVNLPAAGRKDKGKSEKDKSILSLDTLPGAQAAPKRLVGRHFWLSEKHSGWSQNK